jgi:hypothetical protein
VAITVDGERAGVAGRGAADLHRLLGCDRSFGHELGDIDQEFHGRHANFVRNGSIAEGFGVATWHGRCGRLATDWRCDLRQELETISTSCAAPPYVAQRTQRSMAM